jgi:hypothetical protein
MFHNYLVFTDADSLGLFQQRVSYYSAPVTANPARATNAFLDRLVTVHGWATRPLTEVAADVQMPRLDLRGAYAKWQPRAAATTPTARSSGRSLFSSPHRTLAVSPGPAREAAQPLSRPVWPCAGRPPGTRPPLRPGSARQALRVGVSRTHLLGLLLTGAGRLGFGGRRDPAHVGMVAGRVGAAIYLVNAPHTGAVVQMTPASQSASRIVNVRRIG